MKILIFLLTLILLATTAHAGITLKLTSSSPVQAMLVEFKEWVEAGEYEEGDFFMWEERFMKEMPKGMPMEEIIVDQMVIILMGIKTGHVDLALKAMSKLDRIGSVVVGSSQPVREGKND